jgi:HK97 family phage prohead protease
MERLDFGLDLKGLSEAGVLEGYASTYHNVDRVGDVIQPGAFTKTLQEQGGKFPLLGDHDPRVRAGVALLEDRPTGLKLKGLLNLGSTAGRELYAELKFFAEHGLGMGLSIGFVAVKDRWVNGVRHLLEVALWEVSCTTFPANPKATGTAVKGDPRQAWVELLRDMQRFNRAHQAPRPPTAADWQRLLREMQGFVRGRQPARGGFR